MKKRYQILSLFTMIAAVNMLNPSIGSTADATITSDKGTEITITATATGLVDMKFQPSPQVTMAGLSGPSAFSVAAAHDSVLTKENGEAYAMTSEASGLFSKKVPVASDIAVGTSAGLLTAAYTLPNGTKFTEFPAVEEPE